MTTYLDYYKLLYTKYISYFHFLGKYYGPLHYSRHDHVSQIIMRGRDYGLPDYNTVREQVGLARITKWEDINPWLHETNPEVFIL